MTESATRSDPFGLLGDLSEEELAALLEPRENEVTKKKSPAAATARPAARAAAPAAAPPTKKKTATNMKIGRIKERAPAQNDMAVAAARLDANDTCAACGSAMRIQELERRCEDCGLVVERDSSSVELGDEKAPGPAGRLRIVGANSGFYQPDLDRSSSSDNIEAAQKQTYAEYCECRDSYVRRTGKPFPLSACGLAAEYYSKLARVVTKRSSTKRTIMAACLRAACAHEGFMPDKSVFADFMGLKTHGIARGENFVRMMRSNGHIDLDANPDTLLPNISTAFTSQGLDARYEPLQRVVLAVTIVAISNNIGTSSVLRSKAISATYVVLKRFEKKRAASEASGLRSPATRWVARRPAPAPETLRNAEKQAESLAESLGAASMAHRALPEISASEIAAVPTIKVAPITTFCQKCSIRKTTIERFIAQLNEHHSYFREIYIGAGIHAEKDM